MKEMVEKVLNLLENGKGLQQEEIVNPSMEVLKLVSIILNECKCSIIDNNGNFIRYGSSINISVVEQMILNLLSEQNKIPKEITEKALTIQEIKGPEIDIVVEKIYDHSKEKIELQIEPIIFNSFEEILGKNNSEMQTKIIEEVLKPYVKQLIFSNNTLMKRSPVGAFISKAFFRKKTPEQIKKVYLKIIKEYLNNYDEYQIQNTVNYIVDNIMFNNMFKTELINKAINSTELQILGRVYTGFSGLVYNMITTTISMILSKPSPNERVNEIKEIFNTMVEMLKVLNTDLEHLEQEQIAKKIKQVNGYFNENEKAQYRVNQIEIDDNILYVPYNYIENTMNNLCLRIKALLLNKNEISNEDKRSI